MQLDFCADINLENERALLRPLAKSDLHLLLPFSQQETDLWKFSLQGAAGEANLALYIEQALEGRTQQREYPFIIFDKQSGRYAGCTRFYDIQLPYDTLQLGYTWYGKDFQGTGLNKNCKFLLLDFAFSKLQAKRVEFRADNDNKRSIAAMMSIGCKVDGILRSNMPKPAGGRRDSIVLSILCEEWFDHVKDELRRKL